MKYREKLTIRTCKIYALSSLRIDSMKSVKLYKNTLIKCFFSAGNAYY